MAMEDELRRALRAEDPGAAFTQRILARTREERTPSHAHASADSAEDADDASKGHTPEHRRLPATGIDARAGERAAASRMMPRWLMAVAASLALAVTGMQVVQQRRHVAEGERARAQVLAALRLTSEKLNRVHDAIHEPANR